MTGIDSKRQAALDKLFAVENELGLHYESEQEPVATLFGSLPVYDTAPPKRPWVGLTDEEIDVIYEQHHNQYGECESPNFGYERAIEAKLKEKNFD